MSETANTIQEIDEDTMQPEYEIDYTNLRPNPFIKREPGSRVMVIEPDVASIFTTQEQVNAALRALISAMPKTVLKTGA